MTNPTYPFNFTLAANEQTRRAEAERDAALAERDALAAELAELRRAVAGAGALLALVGAAT